MVSLIRVASILELTLVSVLCAGVIILVSSVGVSEAARGDYFILIFMGIVGSLIGLAFTRFFWIVEYLVMGLLTAFAAIVILTTFL